jgi:hypothetical protein
VLAPTTYVSTCRAHPNHTVATATQQTAYAYAIALYMFIGSYGTGSSTAKRGPPTPPKLRIVFMRAQNDHAKIWLAGPWGNGSLVEYGAGPFSPDPTFLNSSNCPATEGVGGIGEGECYFVDSQASNNWIAHRVRNATHNYVYAESYGKQAMHTPTPVRYHPCLLISFRPLLLVVVVVVVMMTTIALPSIRAARPAHERYSRRLAG